MDGTVSLVFAITGHRDLIATSADSYREEIGRIFEKFRTLCPNTPLLLLSGLAEGADRIAVHAARASKVPYVAVLPMAVDLYRKDFAAKESLEEFELLLQGAARRIEMPVAPGCTAEQIGQPGNARNLQYREQGRFLVQYSQILIAIWDDQIGQLGGTSDVVMMKLGRDATASPSASPDAGFGGLGPVFVLPAHRSSSPAGKIPALRCEERYPIALNESDCKASYLRLDKYNADAARVANSSGVQKSRRYLFEDEEAIDLSEAMEWVAAVYASADSMAIHFAKVSLWLWQVVFALLAISGVALAWVHVLQGSHEVLVGYYVCLVLAFVLIMGDRKTQLRGRHEDYRALAEALRVQFFWMAAGLPDVASGQYMLKRSGEMTWIRNAISQCGLYGGTLQSGPVGGRELAMRLRLGHKWVEGQAKYFFRSQHRHERKRRYFNYLARACGVIGLAAPLYGWYRGEPVEPESHAVAAIALWWGALIWNYVERRGFEQEAREYARMCELFHRADKELQEFEIGKNLAGSVETIRDLGREALEENGSWLGTHRERQLSPHQAVGG